LDCSFFLFGVGKTAFAQLPDTWLCVAAYIPGIRLLRKVSREGLMDVRIFFQKVRQVEAAITTPHAVVVSLETPDGGKAGTMTEVSRIMASRLVVENKARLASDEETNEFYGRKPNARTPKA
jgi:hypothetical protein